MRRLCDGVILAALAFVARSAWRARLARACQERPAKPPAPSSRAAAPRPTPRRGAAVRQRRSGATPPTIPWVDVSRSSSATALLVLVLGRDGRLGQPRLADLRPRLQEVEPDRLLPVRRSSFIGCCRSSRARCVIRLPVLWVVYVATIIPYIVVHNKQRSAASDRAHGQLVAALLRHRCSARSASK